MKRGKVPVFVFRLWADQVYPSALHSEVAAEMAGEHVADEGEEADIRPLVLVVEDNDDIRDYVASSFDEGYRVVTAMNGREGWGEAQRLVPDIIVSDIMMPEMDGIGYAEGERRCTYQPYTGHFADGQRFHPGQGRRI